jgi:signal recognition particle-docking protein FtsY
MFNLVKRRSKLDNNKISESSDSNTASGFLFGKIKRIFTGNQLAVDQKLLSDSERLLLESDLGVKITQIIISALEGLRGKSAITWSEVSELIKRQLVDVLKTVEIPLVFKAKPTVILIVGLNGVGKTTTIGKLAKFFKEQNQRVLLAAGDTFRAAAIEQLKVWAERSGTQVIAQASGVDSSAVLFDAFQAAKARGFDLLLADTAGRLHTQQNYLGELKKIRRVLQKIDPEAPHETWMVLDATTGQDALKQVKEFNELIKLSGICLTKLDGTAKGGMIFGIAKELGIPIRFVGVGEQIEDLAVFDANQFVRELIDR